MFLIIKIGLTPRNNSSCILACEFIHDTMARYSWATVLCMTQIRNTSSGALNLDNFQVEFWANLLRLHVLVSLRNSTCLFDCHCGLAWDRMGALCWTLSAWITFFDAWLHVACQNAIGLVSLRESVTKHEFSLEQAQLGTKARFLLEILSNA